MKSFAIVLTALVSASAFAEDKDYWENREVAPTQISEEQVEQDKQQAQAQQQAPAEGSQAAEGAPAEQTGHERRVARRQARRERRQERRANWMNPSEEKGGMRGISVEAGGGFGGFMDNRISSVTTAQGQWTLRGVVGTRSHFGAEAAYVGSAQTLNVSGVSSNATIVGNGLEGAFRFNMMTGMWQPYAIAGLGYTHYSLGNAAVSTADVSSEGNVATFPLGVGLAWRINHIVLDGRISFHPATSSDLVRDSNMSTWDMNARAGFEF